MRALSQIKSLTLSAVLCCTHLPVSQADVFARLPPVTDRGPTVSTPPPVAYPVQQATALESTRGRAAGSRLTPVPETVEPARLDPVEGDSATTADRTANVFPIDLTAAMRLADRANPEIGIARQRIVESLAVQLQARSIMLPNLNGGTNLHVHNGPLQRSAGGILSLAEKSLYVGGGSRTLAAESVKYPMVQIFAHLTDAIYEPLAARQRVAARQFDSNATFNTILLDVSTGYIDLMAAEAKLAVLQDSYANALEAARTTSDFAEVGQARQADADRTQTEAALINSEIQLAVSERAVASAELCRLLNLDPAIRLSSVSNAMPVLLLVDPSYSLEQLIGVALEMRPDLLARNADIAEKQAHYRQERMRPLLPTISVGFSAGSFGGGSNLQQPPFNVPGSFNNFGARTDFDAMALWTMENFGAGNSALWRARRAERDQEIAKRSRTLNLVREQVTAAYALVTAGRREIDAARLRLSAAEKGFAEELGRVKGGEGLPIELIDNLTRLVKARLEMIVAIATYDKAQFQLFVALGQPPTLALPNAQPIAAANR